MIVVDSSSLVAILEQEPDHATFFELISGADRRVLSSVNHQETGQVVFARRGASGVRQLEDLLTELAIEIVPHDGVLSRMAIEAFQTYGKGIHPRARLNLGDCAAYALSKRIGAPLLFKGEDFTSTDIVSALSSAP